VDASNPFSELGPYELRHLPVHLAEAGEDDVLDRLLRLEYHTETRSRNAWFDAKDSDDVTDNPALYTLDVATAWRVAERRSVHEIDRGAPAVAVGAEFVYATLTGSTVSLAQHTSPVLRAALLKNGRWSARRALDDAQRVADTDQHIEALEALLPLLTDADRLSALHDALPRAAGMKDAFWRARALIQLGELSPSDLRTTARREALDAVPDMDKNKRLGTLLDIVADLPSELSADALDVLDTLEQESSVADVLAQVAPHLSVEQQPRAMRVARALDDSYARALALAALSAAFPQEPGFALAAEALRAARDITHRGGRAYAVIAIAPYIADRLSDQVLDEVIAADPFYHPPGLAATIPHLAPSAARRGLMALAAIEDENRRAATLEEIVPELSPELLHDAVSLALDITPVEPRATLLLALANRGADVLVDLHATIAEIEEPRILGEICATFGWADPIAEVSLERALDAAFDANRFNQIMKLRALAPALPARLAARALAALGTLDSDYTRAEILTALATHIPDELLDAALEIVGAMSTPDDRARSYRGLLPRLAGKRLAHAARQALRAVAETPIRSRRLLLDELVPLLPIDQLAEAAALGQVIADEDGFVEAVLALAPALPPEARTSALRDALNAARSIEDEVTRRLTLEKLVGRLPNELLADALDMAREFGDDRVRGGALAAIAPFLDDRTRAAVLAEARFDARAIDDATDRSWSLMSHARATDRDDRGDSLVDALAAAEAIWQDDERAMALAALVPDLPPELLGDVFESAMTMTFDEYDRAYVLKALAPRVSGDLAGKVLEAAQGISRDQYRAMVLEPLIKQLPPELRTVVRADAEASDPDARTMLLEALGDELPTDEAKDVRETARAAARDIQFLPSRAAALARLADGSPEHAREALDAVREIEDEWSRSTTLAEIATFLPDELANDIATLARTFAGARERAGVLAAMAEHVSRPAGTELAREAIANVQDSDWQLEEVAGKLETWLGSATVDELLMELDRVRSDKLRARVAKQLRSQELHEAWNASLSRLAAQGREALFAQVDALVPQASALGGERALVDMARCLTEVRRWWP
jgi:hypothetical protein